MAGACYGPGDLEARGTDPADLLPAGLPGAVGKSPDGASGGLAAEGRGKVPVVSTCMVQTASGAFWEVRAEHARLVAGCGGLDPDAVVGVTITCVYPKDVRDEYGHVEIVPTAVDPSGALTPVTTQVLRELVEDWDQMLAEIIRLRPAMMADGSDDPDCADGTDDDTDDDPAGGAEDGPSSGG